MTRWKVSLPAPADTAPDSNIDSKVMNPKKVIRGEVAVLTDLPNIGPSIAKDLQRIGINDPGQLIGQSPYPMYAALCHKTGRKHDPCLIDVFLSITHFMNGGAPQPWWNFTTERKAYLKKHRVSENSS